MFFFKLALFPIAAFTAVFVVAPTALLDQESPILTTVAKPTAACHLRLFFSSHLWHCRSYLRLHPSYLHWCQQASLVLGVHYFHCDVVSDISILVAPPSLLAALANSFYMYFSYFFGNFLNVSVQQQSPLLWAALHSMLAALKRSNISNSSACLLLRTYRSGMDSWF